MLNSQRVVMAQINKKELQQLGAHCHHCKTTKTKQKPNRMLTTLKHYIALVSQKNIKQKQNTWQQAWNLMPLMQHKFIKKKQRMMMASFEELPPHLQQRKQTQNNDLSN